jgi:hypothetical protein
MYHQERADRIRELNDDFRRTGAGGKVVITEGVNMLGDELTEQAIQAVRAFDALMPTTILIAKANVII